MSNFFEDMWSGIKDTSVDALLSAKKFFEKMMVQNAAVSVLTNSHADQRATETTVETGIADFITDVKSALDGLDDALKGKAATSLRTKVDAKLDDLSDFEI